MKLILALLLTTAIALSAKGYVQDTIYQQKAMRRIGGRYFFVAFKRGSIVLTQDSVIFDCKKKNGIFSLAFSYNDIRHVRRYSDLWAFPVSLLFGIIFCDHGVSIEMKSGRKCKFFTFKRKKIIKTIRSKIAG